MNVMPQSCLASDGRDSLTASFSASYAGVLAFIAVAAEGSFARAGDRLGIGRSAVSRSVQKLEGQLGVRLFLRTTRSTTLTREGELFLEGCSPGVASILQALDEMRDLREGPPRGHLRISATHGFGRRVIAPLLSAFRAEHPQVSVELLFSCFFSRWACLLRPEALPCLLRDGSYPFSASMRFSWQSFSFRWDSSTMGQC